MGNKEEAIGNMYIYICVCLFVSVVENWFKLLLAKTSLTLLWKSLCYWLIFFDIYRFVQRQFAAARWADGLVDCCCRPESKWRYQILSTTYVISCVVMAEIAASGDGVSEQHSKQARPQASKPTRQRPMRTSEQATIPASKRASKLAR